ncbi:MAG: hypothetical protein ACTH32_06745 [Microbacterium gubbeenense]|uniref:hypothetical protein n=1 Tax=Microbacterium gubbeenense TaxID=159896 RepID=UPI003F9C8493
MPQECVIQESAGAMRASEGGTWQATLITAGEGSSGIYSEEMLAEHGPTAFPKGTKLWFVHPNSEKGEGPGDRDPRDQWGVLEEDATHVAGEGLTGPVRVLSHWKDVVEGIGTEASLSIYSAGMKDEAGNITLNYHRTNSIDMVGYPGREGSGLTRKIEAARAASTHPDAASAQGNPTHQEEHMDELKEKVDALAESLTALAGKFDKFVENAEAIAQANDDADGAAEAVVKSLEAVKAAALIGALEKPLIEAAVRGDDVASGIEDAKKVMSEAKEAAVKADTSLNFYQSTGSSDDFSL